MTAGCTARIDGHDLRPTTKDAPLILDPNDSVDVFGSSEGTVTSYRVKLKFGFFGVTAASGSANGDEWGGTVDVADYSRFGAGLYEVRATTSGSSPCAGSGWVLIDRNPFTTVAGVTAMGLTLLGLGGLLLSLKSKAVFP